MSEFISGQGNLGKLMDLQQYMDRAAEGEQFDPGEMYPVGGVSYSGEYLQQIINTANNPDVQALARAGHLGNGKGESHITFADLVSMPVEEIHDLATRANGNGNGNH